MQKTGFCLSSGALLMILGAYPLLYVYAFASMIDPEIDEWDYWIELLGRMFNFSDAGYCSLLGSLIFLSGAGLFLYGTVAAIRGGVRWAWRKK